MSTGKIINSKLAVRDGRLACDCCGPGDPDPPWVCPGCFPDGDPNGPSPPSNPDGILRCCGGTDICTPTDDEPLYLGFQLNGQVSNQYTYANGPNAGTTFNYSADWNETFVGESGSCQKSESGFVNVTVPYVSRYGDPRNPVDRTIQIRADGVSWNSSRGFFGGFADTGDDPVFDTSSGIPLTVLDIRGTSGGNYELTNRICRSDFPLTPISLASARPDTFRLSEPPATTLEGGTDVTTTPSLVCLNKVVYEFERNFLVNTVSGDTNSITIINRFYAFVARLLPCPTELIV